MYYTTWSQLLFWDTICPWQYRVFSEMKTWKLMTHCIAASGIWMFPNSESFISQNIWHLCPWKWRRLADCPRHRSDLGLPGGSHGARSGEADLWQLVVYRLPVIVQGRGLPIHNTHHILFLGSKHKLIDCFASVSTASGHLEDDAGCAHQHGHGEDPEEESVQNLGHVLPVLYNLNKDRVYCQGGTQYNVFIFLV